MGELYIYGVLFVGQAWHRETLAQPDTRKREITALQEAMRERHVGEATIVTRDDDENVETTDGVIYVVPAWRYLLEV